MVEDYFSFFTSFLSLKNISIWFCKIEPTTCTLQIVLRIELSKLSYFKESFDLEL